MLKLETSGDCWMFWPQTTGPCNTLGPFRVAVGLLHMKFHAWMVLSLGIGPGFVLADLYSGLLLIYQASKYSCCLRAM